MLNLCKKATAVGGPWWPVGPAPLRSSRPGLKRFEGRRNFLKARILLIGKEIL